MYHPAKIASRATESYKYMLGFNYWWCTKSMDTKWLGQSRSVGTSSYTQVWTTCCLLAGDLLYIDSTRDSNWNGKPWKVWMHHSLVGQSSIPGRSPLARSDSRQVNNVHQWAGLPFNKWDGRLLALPCGSLYTYVCVWGYNYSLPSVLLLDAGRPYGDNCTWKGIAWGGVAVLLVIIVDYMQRVLLLFCNNLFA